MKVPYEDAIDAVRRDDDATEVPGRLEANVMRAWDVRVASAQSPRHLPASAWFSALAAGVLIALSVARSGPPSAPAAGVPNAVDAFVPGITLDEDPASLQYVRMQMTPAMLATLGLPIADVAGDGVVNVEVVIGIDGAPRAIRRAASVEEMR